MRSNPPSKIRFLDLIRTPGKRRQRIIVGSVGLLFVSILILAIAGVFSKNPAAPVVEPVGNDVGAGTDVNDENVRKEQGHSGCTLVSLVDIHLTYCLFFNRLALISLKPLLQRLPHLQLFQRVLQPTR